MLHLLRDYKLNSNIVKSLFKNRYIQNATTDAVRALDDNDIEQSILGVGEKFLEFGSLIQWSGGSDIIV